MVSLTLFHLNHHSSNVGAKWLSGRVLDLRPKGRGFEHHQRHWVVSLGKNINPSLVLVQPRKTRPFITARLLMGRKESNQTNKQTVPMLLHLLYHRCYGLRNYIAASYNNRSIKEHVFSHFLPSQYHNSNAPPPSVSQMLRSLVTILQLPTTIDQLKNMVSLTLFHLNITVPMLNHLLYHRCYGLP